MTIYDFLLLLFIIILCASPSKQIVEKIPIFPRLCLYILNLLIFYLTFSIQKNMILSKAKPMSDKLNFFDNWEYSFVVIIFYSIIFIIVYGISRVYKNYKNGEELTNLGYSIILATLLAVIIPGTSYLIISVIIIDLIILFTKKVKIRYIAILIAWIFLLLINIKIATDESKQAAIDKQQNQKVITTKKVKTKSTLNWVLF